MKRQRTITLKLTKRNDGMWCKKIGGKLEYFGAAGCDEADARRELLRFIQLRDAQAPPERNGHIKLSDLSERYAVVCESRVSGKAGLQGRTWKQYDAAITEFIALVGDRDAANLVADDFAKVARKWREHRGVNRSNNDIQAVRTMFKWAFENGLIDRTPIYGREFRKVATSMARMEQFSRGMVERKFSKDEIATMLKHATGQLRAMILIALNAGLYSVDVADLKWSDIRTEGKHRIVDTTRYKTGIPRRFVLWPETIEALSKIERGNGLIFVTPYGNAWNQRNHTDSIALKFGKFLRKIGIKREGVNFGAFRHTHVSAVGDHPDLSAARLVRGHQIDGIERHYDFPSIERLKSLTEHARRRLLPRTAKAQRAGIPSSRSSKSRGRAAASAV